MTPEQRLDRAENILLMLVKAGRRARNEWREQSRAQDEKINILIHTQMETSEQINRFAATTEKALAELAASQAKTDEALRAFLDRRRRRNGDS